MFLLHVSKMPSTQMAKQQPSESVREIEKTPDDTKSSGDEGIKPRYDFYRLLKENQPPHNLRSETPANSTSNGNTSELTDANTSYLLQVASYKTAEDAEATRAKLLLLGLTARVEKVTLRNTETWHRVLIGPVKTMADTDKVRAQLTENKYDALVLKFSP